MAARYAAWLLRSLEVPVELSLMLGGPPQLVLSVQGRNYIVATECNGFGLLVSAILLATMIGVAYRLPWGARIGLWMVAVPVAIGANFLRIVSICLVAPQVPVSYHVVHEVLGNVFYFGGLVLIWLLARPHRV
ncbi:MAG: exosortase/archaeosortase family protein [Verrucomicrobiae bacterium]|nr:exosortase/archaeosortase family protein [Verrucomicrobiae bacterium]